MESRKRARADDGPSPEDATENILEGLSALHGQCDPPADTEIRYDKGARLYTVRACGYRLPLTIGDFVSLEEYARSAVGTDGSMQTRVYFSPAMRSALTNVAGVLVVEVSLPQYLHSAQPQGAANKRGRSNYPTPGDE